VIKTLSRSHQAVIFYGFAFALAVVCAIVSVPAIIYMFTPTLATLIMLLVVTREGYSRSGWTALGLTRLDVRSWPAAIMIPIAAVGIGFGVLWAAGLVGTVVPFSEIGWPNTALYYLAHLVLNTISFSLGEEIGWRGYLLPRMVESLGKVRSYILLGLGWAAWHYPLIFSGQYQSEGNPVIVSLLFTVTLIPLSIVIGELYLNQHSIWVASLFHSSHNAIWGLATNFSAAPILLVYVIGESLAIPLVVYSIIAFWMLRRRPSRQLAV
jgi:CAAX protease family protein